MGYCGGRGRKEPMAGRPCPGICTEKASHSDTEVEVQRMSRSWQGEGYECVRWGGVSR